VVRDGVGSRVRAFQAMTEESDMHALRRPASRMSWGLSEAHNMLCFRVASFIGREINKRLVVWREQYDDAEMKVELPLIHPAISGTQPMKGLLLVEGGVRAQMRYRWWLWHLLVIYRCYTGMFCSKKNNVLTCCVGSRPNLSGDLLTNYL
jgi:hypothetical protein